MTEATISAGSVPATIDGAIVTPKGRRLRRRHLWLIPGLAIAVYANELGKQIGLGIIDMIELGVAVGIAPHVPLLLKYVGTERTARPASFAIPMFNLLHHPLVALATFVLVAGAVINGIVPVVVLVATLVWVSHIVIGWGLGDVLRHEGAHR